ncbi:MAG: hypothetical protein ACFFD4_06785 [Candidatus Odinarchaeota archaeon]
MVGLEEFGRFAGRSTGSKNRFLLSIWQRENVNTFFFETVKNI